MHLHTPDWVKHAVFYQIFPDRFARANHPDLPIVGTDRLEAWDAPPTLQGYKGGNFWGILDKLDYLQDLGITALYFTPIFQSASNHRYHTHDYYQVDPLLGGNQAFQHFLEAAHRRNLKVVLDGVFNHASRGFFFFNDILENGFHSPWVDWFRVQEWPLNPYTGALPANYLGWADNRALPVFNHDHPEVRQYLMQIAEHWLRVGIDGWRLDVPEEITAAGFWQEFRDRVKAINPEAYIVGEIWKNAQPWLEGNQFDGVMNYLFAGPTIAFTAGDRVILDLVEHHQDYQPYPALDAAAYGAKIQALLELYPWEIQLTQLNLLASHDTARLLSIAGHDRASVELATLLLCTFPGAPNIYYGDEVGLDGGIDPDCRRSFPPAAQWDQQLYDCHRQLIALRHQYPALRTGEYRILLTAGMVYGFARILEDQAVVVVVNSGPTQAPVRIDWPQTGLSVVPQQLYGKAQMRWHGAEQCLELDLLPRSGCILG